MAEFSMALRFSLGPMALACLLGLLLPPLGVGLVLRREILLGLTLPALGSAVIALALFLGLSDLHPTLVFSLACSILFMAQQTMELLQRRWGRSGGGAELVLLTCLVMSETLALLLAALSPRVDVHAKALLRGEILAAGAAEVTALGIFALLFATVGLRFRGAWIALVADPRHFALHAELSRAATIFYHALVSVALTAGIFLAGPLVVTGLLFLPAAFLVSRARGLLASFLMSAAIGSLGSLLGFSAAIVMDIPPSYGAVTAVLILSAAYGLIPRKA